MRRLNEDAAASARIDRLAEIEARIDPTLRRRGRIVADLVTVAVAAPIAIAFDFHVTRPFVLLALMGAALALNRLVPLITEQRLRGERNRLLTRPEVLESEIGQGP